MQTPLAVIRAKLERLLNENELNDNQLDKVKTIYETVNRLTRLNKDLLLLTKIENKQFTDEKDINLKQLIKDKLDDWQELISRITSYNVCYTKLLRKLQTEIFEKIAVLNVYSPKPIRLKVTDPMGFTNAQRRNDFQNQLIEKGVKPISFRNNFV